MGMTKLEKFMDILQQYVGKGIEIRPETYLESDLGICGEDASELIQTICQAFSLDHSGFDFHKYFSGEPIFFGEQDHHLSQDMTIGYLWEAVEKGVLE
jgi:hypothetical protein